MSYFKGIPTILGRDTSKPAKRNMRGYDLAGRHSRPHKYDHAAMLADRMAGVSWLNIGSKHGIHRADGVSDKDYANRVRRLLLHSTVGRNLSPDQVVRLDALSRGHNSHE